jgi:heme-degrading monooxygenase HmoA
MLKHVELDPSLPMSAQYADTTNSPVILINLFDVDPQDAAAFKDAWAKDAAFFKAQPGYISSQLHHGIGNSRMWLNYAVFETVADFAATNDQPEFKPLLGIYPDSTTSRPALFRCVAVSGICVDKH